MPINLSDKKPDENPDEKSKDWRPPVGTRVLIIDHGSWKNRTGVIDAHEKWMGMITLSVKIDGEGGGHRAGITAPNQIRILEND